MAVDEHCDAGNRSRSGKHVSPNHDRNAVPMDGVERCRRTFRLTAEICADPMDEDIITRLQLAAFASLGFLGLNFQAGLGLSHSLGYALGAPYQIPHGITSCMTLVTLSNSRRKARRKTPNSLRVWRRMLAFKEWRL